MPDFDHILKRCREVSRITSSVVDNFIIHYAAQRDQLDREFDAKISRFRHMQKELSPSWTGMVTAQYIAHRIFREQGLVHKYLKHAAIKALPADELNYLRQSTDIPWRFSFSVIISNPAADFYEMEDVFTGNTYLLYSGSVTSILSERPVFLWFNLIGYNGSCWQTYGPVTYFQSFDADDIFYFATELDPSIESDEDLVDNVENNPVPYMLLVYGSQYPRMQQNGYELVQVSGECPVQAFDMAGLKKKFTIEYNEGVFRLRHKTLSEPPHYAEAFYDEKQETLYLKALTEKGYMEMAKHLSACQFSVPRDPDIRVHLTMSQLIKTMLKRESPIDPYGKLFEPELSPDQDLEMKKLNNFMSLLLPYLNDNNEPDIDALANQAGIDRETADQLYENVKKSIRK